MNTIIILCFIAYFIILADVVNPFLGRRLQSKRFSKNQIREWDKHTKMLNKTIAKIEGKPFFRLETDLNVGGQANEFRVVVNGTEFTEFKKVSMDELSKLFNIEPLIKHEDNCETTDEMKQITKDATETIKALEKLEKTIKRFNSDGFDPLNHEQSK